MGAGQSGVADRGGEPAEQGAARPGMGALGLPTPLTRAVTEVTTCRDPHRAYARARTALRARICITYAIVLARVLGTVIGRPRYFRYLAGQRPGALDAKGPR